MSLRTKVAFKSKWILVPKVNVFFQNLEFSFENWNETLSRIFNHCEMTFFVLLAIVLLLLKIQVQRVPLSLTNFQVELCQKSQRKSGSLDKFSLAWRKQKSSLNNDRDMLLCCGLKPLSSIKVVLRSFTHVHIFHLFLCNFKHYKIVKNVTFYISFQFFQIFSFWINSPFKKLA